MPAYDFTFDTGGQTLVTKNWCKRVLVHEQNYSASANYTVQELAGVGNGTAKMGAGVPYEFVAPKGAEFPPNTSLGIFTASVGSIPCSVEEKGGVD
jgi:hypothetical protein